MKYKPSARFYWPCFCADGIGVWWEGYSVSLFLWPVGVRGCVGCVRVLSNWKVRGP